ncbi:DUF3717 domain-containing protein [Burkholderia gladioli pv. gladioli]|uniref:DUF3717 domain-containing protein n=1 Tax=Burkholderia gladioli TaxID=28095 RepID=UPI0005D8A576|nr:DUF3717 domain-containing protein [Burkholderia gladioli]AJW93853.1 hypothetical protein BM43_7355 [Burkholderia gladioli]ASD84743.1 hypothetical protein CEJ98_37820 [Burkholderia gladioli pv. gladioli]AWY49765.1 hypothetical protein A8H28_00400 [Burkholderia gladioli pv. gladioli]MDJ1167573.1 DUF3717 domain-containing protein [Burkholderia gladioli pv. gladioli]MDR8093197.1 DUF3717 domain-containing protein [Burkholderia gladioli]
MNQTAIPNPFPSGAVSIVEIESAINVWRNRSAAPAGPDELLVLCSEARVLADVYGAMIASRATSVPRSSLTVKQAAALAGASA